MSLGPRHKIPMGSNCPKCVAVVNLPSQSGGLAITEIWRRQIVQNLYGDFRAIGKFKIIADEISDVVFDEKLCVDLELCPKVGDGVFRRLG